MWADVGTLLLGSVLLLFGTDSLVNGVSGLLARRVGESYLFSLAGAMVAGLAPLLAVVVAGLLSEQADLVLGGIIGSAIAELGLLLGLSALTAPLLARLKVFAWINPVLVASVLLVWALGTDHAYAAVDGGILVAAFVLVAVLITRAVSRERVAAKVLFEQRPPTFAPGLLLLRTLAGVLLLGLGAWRLLVGGSGLAAVLVVNPLIVGLLVLGPASVLAGAPTAVMAARRGRGDFALGQALFGAMSAILLVLGALALIHPLAIPASMIRLELPVLLTLAVAVYPMIRSDGELSSREGALLMLAYLAFVATEIWLTSA
jgi:cation:H+ antiporter